jgi:2-polyprenyl-6-methoxyphenol hydroxylase-like FAD-dependent oxidoreductase
VKNRFQSLPFKCNLQRYSEGDVMIGADGIRSKIRAQIRNDDPENPPLAYAGYAVYTAICDYSAPHREVRVCC